MEPADSEHSSSLKISDYSDSESAPASSWSTIPNRTLLCRPLPVDIGRCTCVIVKEKCVEGLHGDSLYTVYTNVRRVMEDNRKLAVARHKRHNGRSEFIVAQSTKGILGPGDDSFVGSVTSNLIVYEEVWSYFMSVYYKCKKCRKIEKEVQEAEQAHLESAYAEVDISVD
ncbi:hypothetical protein AgCh_015572 [Apium graveolens]